MVSLRGIRGEVLELEVKAKKCEKSTGQVIFLYFQQQLEEIGSLLDKVNRGQVRMLPVVEARMEGLLALAIQNARKIQQVPNARRDYVDIMRVVKLMLKQVKTVRMVG